MIFALDLEEVKEIRPAGMDLDQVFRWIGSWGR